MTEAVIDKAVSNGSAPINREPLSKGYLPPGARTRIVQRQDIQPSIFVNRFPLGDIENFSASRVAYAQAQKRLGKGDAWEVYAPWEKKYYNALEAVEKAQGEYVSGLDGGFLAPESWGGPYFSLLRGFSVFSQLPITTLNVPARIRHIPKVTGDVVGTYPGENVALTNTAFQLGQVSFTARKAVHLIPISNELIRDAAEMADQVLRLESARYHALDRDTQLLTGQGGPNPTGLIPLATNGTISKYYPGSANNTLQSSANHSKPAFGQVSQLRGKVHQLNGLSGTTVYSGQAHCNGMIAHTRFEQTVLDQPAAANSWTDANVRPLWMGGLGRPGQGSDQYADPANLLGQIWALTNILPINSTDGGGTTSSFIIAGWWDMYVLFESLAFEYEAADLPAAGNDQTLVRAIHRYDGSPARPEAFAVLAGVDA